MCASACMCVPHVWEAIRQGIQLRRALNDEFCSPPHPLPNVCRRRRHLRWPATQKRKNGQIGQCAIGVNGAAGCALTVLIEQGRHHKQTFGALSSAWCSLSRLTLSTLNSAHFSRLSKFRLLSARALLCKTAQMKRKKKYCLENKKTARYFPMMWGQSKRTASERANHMDTNKEKL